MQAVGYCVAVKTTTCPLYEVVVRVETAARGTKVTAAKLSSWVIQWVDSVSRQWILVVEHVAQMPECAELSCTLVSTGTLHVSSLVTEIADGVALACRDDRLVVHVRARSREWIEFSTKGIHGED